MSSNDDRAEAMKEGWRHADTMSRLGIGRSALAAKALFLVVAVVFTGSCSFTVPLNPALDVPSTGSQIALTVGAYYSPEFKEYEAVELVGLHSENRFVRPLGKASVRVFDKALSSLFERVVPVAGRPPLGSGQPRVAAVIEVGIREATFGPPNRGMGWGPAVWAEITYEVTMYSPKGNAIGSWRVRGMGEAQTHAFGEIQVLSRATDRAIQDALTKFVKGFRDVPEVRRWLRENGVGTVGQGKAN